MAEKGSPRASLGDLFDPFGDPYLSDPYPFLAEAQAAAPVFYSSRLDLWMVTRYHDIRRVLQNPRLFSASNALTPVQPICPMAGKELEEQGFRPARALTDNDPPDHTRIRRLANVAFTPKRVARMEPFIREIAVDLIRRRMSDGRTDLIADLAWELPALVLFRILGVPDEEVAQVKAASHSRVLFLWGKPDPEEQVRLARGTAALWNYAEGLVERRAREGGSDFTSMLLRARDGEVPALTRREVATIVYALLFAGHETTTGMLGNTLRWLLEDPRDWMDVSADPALIPNAIEEALRMDSSIIAWRRKAKRAVAIGGVSVPANANLLLLLGAANRDPAVFENPQRFDIRRGNAREHLSFGFGPHLCLGASLARLELRVVLEELTQRFPGMRLVKGQDLRYKPNISHRGPLSLLVELGGAGVNGNGGRPVPCPD